MKIVCISDTHNKHEFIDVGKGDIIIHAGDATGRGNEEELLPFLEWYSGLDFTYKILVAGNHDFGFERKAEKYEDICKSLGVIYLNDSGVEIDCFDEDGSIKIWGSPVQPEFFNWAFNRRVEQKLPDDYDPYHSYNKVNKWIKPHWDKIPKDTDILITHGPPKGMRDECRDMYNPNQRVNVGCPWLMDAIKEIKPKLHVFGHIHEEHGVTVSEGVVFCNASQLNDRYNVNFKPKEFKWTKGQLELK